jgi:hypothetical protein
MSAADLVYGVLGKGEIEKAIASSVTIRAALMEKAEEVQSFWVKYWNELPHPWSRVHTLKSGYVEEPGDYANSIRIYYLRNRSGMMKARVWAKDFKAHWIEYGASAHMSGWLPLHMTGGMPEFAPRQHTLEKFGGGGGVDVVTAD